MRNYRPSEANKEQHRKYYQRNRATILAHCKRRRDGRNPEQYEAHLAYQRQWLKHNKTRQYALGKERRARLKDEVFIAYGGWRCACCGEDERIFLTLDHINNNGAEERRKVGQTYRLFSWLRRQKFPSGYQVLCFNCNCGKRDNGGVCPHATR